MSCTLHRAWCSVSIRCTDTSPRGQSLLSPIFLCHVRCAGHGVQYRSGVQTHRLEDCATSELLFCMCVCVPCGLRKAQCSVLKRCTDTLLQGPPASKSHFVSVCLVGRTRHGLQYKSGVQTHRLEDHLLYVSFFCCASCGLHMARCLASKRCTDTSPRPLLTSKSHLFVS